jgi:glycosyltransferase involved in cell wall biosynthesis
MNLLVFNYAVDETHPVLAFAVPLLRELAGRFEHVDVLTMYEGPHHLPPNVKVWSAGRERGYSRLRRVLAFYRAALRILRERRIDVCFVHMNHVFAPLFWPLARLRRIPMLLWYAHGTVSMNLRVAHRAVDKVISATPESFRIRSTKTEFIGHGVDTALFTPAPRHGGEELVIVTAGRVGPVKQIDVIIDALRDWRGARWRFEIAGAPTSPQEEAYAQRLVSETRGEPVQWLGTLAAPELARVLRRADVFVSVSGTGSLDKALLEAAASGTLVLTSNDAFVGLVGAAGLHECIIQPARASVIEGLERLLALSEAERDAIRTRLRALAEQHSFPNWSARIADELTRMAAENAPNRQGRSRS